VPVLAACTYYEAKVISLHVCQIGTMWVIDGMVFGLDFIDIFKPVGVAARQHHLAIVPRINYKDRRNRRFYSLHEAAIPPLFDWSRSFSDPYLPFAQQESKKLNLVAQSSGGTSYTPTGVFPAFYTGPGMPWVDVDVDLYHDQGCVWLDNNGNANPPDNNGDPNLPNSYPGAGPNLDCGVGIRYEAPPAGIVIDQWNSGQPEVYGDLLTGVTHLNGLAYQPQLGSLVDSTGTLYSAIWASLGSDLGSDVELPGAGKEINPNGWTINETLPPDVPAGTQVDVYTAAWTVSGAPPQPSPGPNGVLGSFINADMGSWPVLQMVHSHGLGVQPSGSCYKWDPVAYQWVSIYLFSNSYCNYGSGGGGTTGAPPPP